MTIQSTIVKDLNFQAGPSRILQLFFNLKNLKNEHAILQRYEILLSIDFLNIAE